MKIRDTYRPEDMKNTLRQFEGHVVLETIDAETGEVIQRAEGHNNVTPLIEKMIGGGNLFFSIPASKILPIGENFFGGCYLTDQDESAQGYLVAGDSHIVAQASNNSYTPVDGNNARRGSMVSSSCEYVNDHLTLENVWTWTPEQGNVTSDDQDIRSVCLTRPTLGAVNFNEDAVPNDNSPALEFLTSYVNEGTNLQKCSVIDYANERGYEVTYANEVITLNAYSLNTYRLHLKGAVNEVIDLAATQTYNQDLGTVNAQNTTIALESGYLYILHHSTGTGADAGKAILDIFKIDLSDLSGTYSQRKYAGITFLDFNNSIPPFARDAMIVKNGYVYAYATDNADQTETKYRIAKCSLTSDVDVNDDDINPLFLAAKGGQTYSNNRNNSALVFPNGDWIKISSYSDQYMPSLYCHDGEYYMVNFPHPQGSYEMFREVCFTNYGTVLVRRKNVYGGGTAALAAIFSEISTVYNLEDHQQTPVHKTSNLQMRLTYTITEV